MGISDPRSGEKKRKEAGQDGWSQAGGEVRRGIDARGKAPPVMIDYFSSSAMAFCTTFSDVKP